METQEPTAELIARARGGDAGAFGELLLRFRPRLDAFVAARLGPRLRPRVDLDSLIQEVFLRGLRSLDRFHSGGEDELFRWLAGIANHLIQEAARKMREDLVPVDLDLLPADGTSPEKRSERNERFERLQAALDSLSPDHRRVIILARIERLPLKEVARRMERSIEAVTQLLWRALQNLKRSFGATDSFGLPDRSLEDRGGAR